ncbi:polysaccharide biosynthesis tyrosine autokinase [Aeromicrobium sp. P5_D10]
MDLRDYLRIARTRWVSIALCGLITLGIAAALTWASTPQYTSSVRLFVSTSSAADDVQANQGGQFSLQRVKSYANLLTGEVIARRVTEKLRLEEDPRELAKQISASSALDTVILTVKVTDPSPERARVLANTVSEEFVAYVAVLETPPGKDEATIKATIVDPANLSESPISPNPKRNLVIGLALGLLVGAGIAVLRETFDSTIKSTKQLGAIIDAPVLGAIGFDSQAVDTPLVTALDTYAPRTEAFRVLRTNLQFVDPDQDHKVFVVTSSLPSEGKTTTAVNLALVLAEGGERVVLIEADLRRPKVSEYLRLEPTVGLTTVLVGRVELKDALQPTTHPNLTVLASGATPPNPAELLKSKAMSTLLADLREEFDIVLIDSPPLLPVTDGALIAAQADGALLVVRHSKTTVDQITAAQARLEAVGAHTSGIILSMVKASASDAYGYGYGYGYGPSDAKPSSRKGKREPKPQEM